MSIAVDCNGTSQLLLFSFPSVMRLVYRFTDIIKKVKAGKLSLDIPDDYKIQNLDRFLENSIDFSGPEFKDEFGTGLSFYDMDILVQRNREALLKAFGREAEGIQKLVQRMRQDLESRIVDGVSMSADTGLKKIFLTHHRSIQRRVACVYTVINDTYVSLLILSINSLVVLHSHNLFPSFGKQN